MRRPLLFSIIGLLALALVPAQASVIQYALTSDHCTGSCGPAGTTFGTITLTDLAAGTVQVSVSLSGAYRFVTGGGDADIGWNLNLSPDPTISASTPSGWSLVSTSPGSLHMDGTGDFEYGIECIVCGSGASNPQTGPITFTVSASGLSAAGFAEQNAAGQFFAVDIFNSATTGAGAGNTGHVDASSAGVCTGCVSETPEPSSLALVLGGLLVVAARVMRRYV